MTASAVLSSVALKKVIKTPSAVANMLDWRKASGGVATALTIDVHADKLGLALTTLRSEENSVWQQWWKSNSERKNHPFSLGHRDSLVSCRILDPIPLLADAAEQEQQTSTSIPQTTKRKRKRQICPEARRKLVGLVLDHNVCGFVVSWPVQQDTGLMGASCGRTLWALEQLLKEEEEGSTAPPFAPNRPLCLWQRSQIDAKQHSSDAFGRCSIYARTSDKTEHFASKEQYHLGDVLAVEVWRDFCQHHWPAAVDAHLFEEPAQAVNPEDGPQYNQDRIPSRSRPLVAA